MSKQDSLRTQNCILKVNIDCNGCARKVKKRLQKIQGVNSVSVDAEQGKVVVVGDKVDPAKLIKKLKSSGMHAELCGGQQKVDNQFQKKQFNNSKGEKDNKSKKGELGGQVAATQFKGVHDFKIPQKEHKSVKFNLQEEKFDASDDGHDDLEDYSDDEEEEEEEVLYGHQHVHAMPMMRNGAGPRGPAGMNNMMNGPNHKGNNGNGKNGHVIDPTMLIKGKDGNRNHNNENNKSEKYMVGSEGDGIKKKKTKSSGGGLVGRFLRFGKRSKKGDHGAATDSYNHKNNYNEMKEEKEGDGKLEGSGKSKNDLDFHGKTGKGNHTNGNQMGPMGMNNPMDIRAVQRHPGMNGGGGGYHHPQMQMQPPPHNHQQQQHTAMMMNQQHQQQQAYMNMYPQAMMYGRQHPSMNYMPPPPPMPVHPMNDPITHTFSDENVESCTIM